MGRSRGGLTTKIHALVDAEGRPVRLELTAGQAADAPMAEKLDTSNYRAIAPPKVGAVSPRCEPSLVDFLQEAPVGVPGGDFAVMRAQPLMPDETRESPPCPIFILARTRPNALDRSLLTGKDMLDPFVNGLSSAPWHGDVRWLIGRPFGFFR